MFSPSISAPCAGCKNKAWCTEFDANKSNGEYGCINGRTGPGCSKCAINFFLSVGETCVECPDSSVGTLASILLLIVVVIVLGLVVKNNNIESANDARKSALRLATFLLGIDHIQTQSIIIDLNLRWPAFLKTLFAWIYGFFSFNIPSLATSPECQYDFGWQGRWMLSVFSPAMLLLLLLGVHTCCGSRLNNAPVPAHVHGRRARRAVRRQTNRNKLLHEVSILLLLMYLFLAGKLMAVWDCIRYTGTTASVLVEDPSISCDDASLIPLKIVSIVLALVFVIGTPALFYRTLRRGDRTSENLQIQLGWLYLRFEDDYWWWGIGMEMVWRKLPLAFTKVALSRSPLAQGIITSVILAMALVAQAWYRPFDDHENMGLPFSLDTLQIMMLACSLTTIVIGLVNTAVDNKQAKDVLGIFVLLVEIVLALCTMQELLIDLKQQGCKKWVRNMVGGKLKTRVHPLNMAGDADGGILKVKRFLDVEAPDEPGQDTKNVEAKQIDGTFEDVMAAVMSDGLALKLVRKTMRKREVVLAAVLANGLALSFAGEAAQADLEIVVAALNENIQAIQFVSPILLHRQAFTYDAEAQEWSQITLGGRKVATTWATVRATAQELKNTWQGVERISRDGTLLNDTLKQMSKAKGKQIVLAAVRLNGLVLEHVRSIGRSDGWLVGKHVTIKGIVSPSHFNGSTARVVRWSAKTKKYDVQLVNKISLVQTGDRASLEARNLTLNLTAAAGPVGQHESIVKMYGNCWHAVFCCKHMGPSIGNLSAIGSFRAFLCVGFLFSAPFIIMIPEIVVPVIAMIVALFACVVPAFMWVVEHCFREAGEAKSAVRRDLNAGSLTNDLDIALAAVTQNGMALVFADENLKKNESVVIAAVKQNGMALQFAGKNLKQDKSFMMPAVKQNGMALEFAHHELKQDKSVVMSAVEQNGLALQFAIGGVGRSNSPAGVASQTLPRDDKDVVLAAVKQDGMALQFAKLALKMDKDVVLTAVSQTGLALKYAREKQRGNKETVLAAVKQHGLALESANVTMRSDRDVVLAAVTQTGVALEHASDSLKNDRDIVLTAVKQNGMSLEFASEHLKNDRDVVRTAVSQTSLALQYARGNLRGDKETVLAAVKQDGLALESANILLRADKDVVLAAVTQTGVALEFAFLTLQGDKDIVLAAVKQDGLAFEHASEALKTDKEVVLEAVKQNARVFDFVHSSLRADNTFFLACVKENGLLLKYSPTITKIIPIPKGTRAVYHHKKRNRKKVGKHENVEVVKDLCNGKVQVRFDSSVKKIKLVWKDHLEGSLASNVYESVIDETIVDRQAVIAAVAQNGLALQFASEKLRGDKDVVLAAVKQNGLALKFARLGNTDVVLAAVTQNGLALQYANEALRGNTDVVRAAVTQNGLALRFAIALNNDTDIVLAAVKQNGIALEYASAHLRNTYDVVLTAVMQNRKALQFASEDMKRNKKIANLAVDTAARASSALERLSDEWRSDKAVVLKSVKQNGMALQHAIKAADADHARRLLDEHAAEVAAADAQLDASRNKAELAKHRKVLKRVMSKLCDNTDNEAELRAAFDRIDADGGGAIDADELVQLAEIMKVRLGKRDAAALVELLDRDGDGRIRWSELQHHYVQQRATRSQSILELEQMERAAESRRVLAASGSSASLLTGPGKVRRMSMLKRDQASARKIILDHEVEVKEAQAQLDEEVRHRREQHKMRSLEKRWVGALKKHAGKKDVMHLPRAELLEAARSLFHRIDKEAEHTDDADGRLCVADITHALENFMGGKARRLGTFASADSVATTIKSNEDVAAEMMRAMLQSVGSECGGDGKHVGEAQFCDFFMCIAERQEKRRTGDGGEGSIGI